MEDNQDKSSWDELARQLGADVSSPSSEKEGPDFEPADRPEVTIPRITLPPAAPKAAASGWDSLASELGVATPEPEAPSAGDSASPTASQAAPEVGELPRARKEGPEEPSAWSSLAAADDASAAAENAAADVHPAPDKRFLPPAPTDTQQATQKDEAQQTPTQPVPVGEDASSADDAAATQPEAAAAAGGAANFWESIFGKRTTPAATDKIVADEPAPQSDESRLVDVPEPADHHGTPIGAESDATLGREDDLATGDDRSDQPRRRPRRRRRGSGRGERTRDRTGEPPTDRDDSPTWGIDIADQPDDLRPAPTATEASADDAIATKASKPRDKRRSDKEKNVASKRLNSDRNIPTWEEAIHHIVDGNLQLRSERKRAPSGRGRPRGRRKKST